MSFPTRQEIAQNRDANARKARSAQLRTEIRELESELARKRRELEAIDPAARKEWQGRAQAIIDAWRHKTEGALQ